MNAKIREMLNEINVLVPESKLLILDAMDTIEACITGEWLLPLQLAYIGMAAAELRESPLFPSIRERQHANMYADDMELASQYLLSRLGGTCEDEMEMAMAALRARAMCRMYQRCELGAGAWEGALCDKVLGSLTEEDSDDIQNFIGVPSIDHSSRWNGSHRSTSTCMDSLISRRHPIDMSFAGRFDAMAVNERNRKWSQKDDEHMGASTMALLNRSCTIGLKHMLPAHKERHHAIDAIHEAAGAAMGHWAASERDRTGSPPRSFSENQLWDNDASPFGTTIDIMVQTKRIMDEEEQALMAQTGRDRLNEKAIPFKDGIFYSYVLPLLP